LSRNEKFIEAKVILKYVNSGFQCINCFNLSIWWQL